MRGMLTRGLGGYDGGEKGIKNRLLTHFIEVEQERVAGTRLLYGIMASPNRPAQGVFSELPPSVPRVNSLLSWVVGK